MTCLVPQTDEIKFPLVMSRLGEPACVFLAYMSYNMKVLQDRQNMGEKSIGALQRCAKSPSNKAISEKFLLV